MSNLHQQHGCSAALRHDGDKELHDLSIIRIHPDNIETAGAGRQIAEDAPAKQKYLRF